MIEYLQREHIDDKRWNTLVENSPNESLYLYTWFLDASADNWFALVKGDYEILMPVPYRIKSGIKYLYQPVQCQQLGAFSEKKIGKEMLTFFVEALSLQIKQGNYAFNWANYLDTFKGIHLVQNNNHILPLDKEYSLLISNYSENCRRNIKKAAKNGISLAEDISFDELIELKAGIKGDSWNQKYSSYLHNLYTAIADKCSLRVIGAREDDELIAGAIFVCSRKRIYYLLSASNEKGKQYRAMFRIIDSLIQEHAGEDRILDFEGSNIPAIARFFEGFGAEVEKYQRMEFTSLLTKIVKGIKRV